MTATYRPVAYSLRIMVFLQEGTFGHQADWTTQVHCCSTRASPVAQSLRAVALAVSGAAVGPPSMSSMRSVHAATGAMLINRGFFWLGTWKLKVLQSAAIAVVP